MCVWGVCEGVLGEGGRGWRRGRENKSYATQNINTYMHTHTRTHALTSRYLAVVSLPLPTVHYVHSMGGMLKKRKRINKKKNNKIEKIRQKLRKIYMDMKVWKKGIKKEKKRKFNANTLIILFFPTHILPPPTHLSYIPPTPPYHLL